jgi:biopolymer transport protein ExbD
MSSSETNDDGLVTGINVTPMVDIMLVLLIIFMVTTSFVSEAGLKINLPKTATAEASATSSLTVSLNDKGELFLKESKVDIDYLKAVLGREAKINPGVRVTLVADNKLTYQQVMTILDAIKQAGVTRVALASQR